MTPLRSLAFCLLTTALGCSSASDPAPSAPAPTGGPTPAPSDEPPPAHVAACPAGHPFRLVSGKIVVDVTLDDDSKTQSWVLDTGAFSSIADTSLAGRVQDREVKVTVGGTEKKIRFGTMDVKAAMRMDVAGVLGQDVFGEVLTIDYPRQRFLIDAKLDADRDADLRACGHVKGAPATVDAIYKSFLHVRGSVEGKQGWFLVDTGASFGVTRKSVFAAIDQAHPRPSLGGFYTPAAVGKFWARVATVGSMEVGGHEVAHVLTRTIDDNLMTPPKGIAPDELLGVLPSLYLQHFMVTADFVGKKLRLDPAKGDSLREPTILYTIGIGLEERLDPPVLVADVLPGSAAAEAGIERGDELLAIEGRSVGSLDAFTRAFQLVTPQRGTNVEVTVKHAGVESKKVLVARDLLTSPAL